jgi:hypothetical protein
VSASEFRDHWADTDAEWSHGGTWLTSFLLPPTAVADAVSAAAGQMDRPFLMPVSAARGDLTVQGGSHLCRSVRRGIVTEQMIMKLEGMNDDQFAELSIVRYTRSEGTWELNYYT